MRREEPKSDRVRQSLKGLNALLADSEIYFRSDDVIIPCLYARNSFVLVFFRYLSK